MPSFQEDRKLFYTLTVFALMIRCPAAKGQRPECPFDEFRNGYGLEEKFLHAESLSVEKCQEVLAIHESCQASCRPATAAKTGSMEMMRLGKPRLDAPGVTESARHSRTASEELC